MTRAEADNVVHDQGPRVRERYGYDYFAGWRAGLLRAASLPAIVAVEAPHSGGHEPGRRAG